jgi:hypothetical protein
MDYGNVRPPAIDDMRSSYSVQEITCLNNGTNVGQILLIFHGWHALSTNNSVKFLMRALLNIRIRRDQCREPLYK